MTDIDAYMQVAAAQTWLSAHLVDIAAWTANSASQAAALVEASDHIDALPLKGLKYADNVSQPRAFPRVTDRSAQIIPYDSEINYQSETDYSTVPQSVKDACCLEALAILEIKKTADSLTRLRLQREGVVSVNYGGTSEQYASNPGGSVSGAANRYRGMLSKDAYDKLKDWIAGIAEAV